MKKNSTCKYALLAIGLCVCLAVLSGCYIQQDDINSDTAMNTSGTNLRFDTMAPRVTETVSPDTVPIETQNPFGVSNTISVISGETATPGPNPGGWSDWGSVSDGTPGQSQTPVPTSGTIVFSTAVPGSSQAPQTGATDQPTLQVVTKAPATPTVTPPSLQRGFKGSDEVRALQKRLKELGWYTGSVDGDFGAGTETAVKAFQKANGLTDDGKVGKQTKEKLDSKDAVTKKQASATPTPKPTAKVTAKPTARATATPDLSKDYYLSLGTSGKRVTTLQNRLIELGYLGGKATGEYDAATEAAVRAFQKKTRSLYEDGKAGPETLKALYSSGAAKASSVAASTGETLERDSEGDAVRTLQKRLKELGYLSGSVDGKFGQGTEAAVIAFQQANGLTPDGKAGTATLNRLYSDSAIRSSGGSASTDHDSADSGRDTSGIGSTGYVTLELGSRGDQVKKLQERLKTLRYYDGNVDGSYGDGTVAAVMAFQLRNNLTVDGKAGPATQRALFGSGTPISYATLEKGATGDAVRNLQYTLYELGYYDGGIDGDYGDTTADAVRAFQITNSLTPVDGKAGRATLARLYSADAIPATAAAPSYDTARPGDRGELVVEMQDVLVQMGYLDKITGVYDDETTAAVKAFQRECGLTADGVAGKLTLQYLFGY